MIVSRKGLLAKLRFVKPALATNEVVPFTHYLFDGKHLVAANDEIAISVPQLSDFKGAVPRRLETLLSTSRAAAVEIKNRDTDTMQVTLDESVFSLPIHPVQDFQFYMPSEWPAHSVPAAFLRAIEHCLLSISDHPTMPEQLGITLIPTEDGLWLFGTNEMAVSYTRLKPPFKQKQRVILPSNFCRTMLTLAKSAKTWRFDIYLDEGYALFAADDVLLFGRLIHTDNPLDFVDVVQRHVPKTYASTAIPLPKELRSLLKRSTIVALALNDSFIWKPTTIDVKDGIGTFESQSYYIDGATITEHLRMPGHPDVQTGFKVSLLCKACTTEAERILFTEHAVIMNSGPHFYLCTARPSPTVRSSRRMRGLRRSNPRNAS
jgi:DNA polymerase III sliding clamp (beta) subunit (PCNA family)